MKIKSALFAFAALLLSSNSQAQQIHGGEIVSYNTFGEGLMVTRAKMVPLPGMLTNIFFYNRADEPWNGNTWYEYDWELRGRLPFSAWSQIRVRTEPGTALEDAPVNVSTRVNLGNELLHYILIRNDNRYVYDIRRKFDITTYNYNNARRHGGNSRSLLTNGPRIYQTGGALDHIPEWARLDFSLGITAFDSNWAGTPPSGDFSREVEVDFTRFYSYSGGTLNTSPLWSDEFDGNTLDSGKWYEANWSFGVTQFRPENVRVSNGYLYLRVNRGESSGTNPSVNLALNGVASQSSTGFGGVAGRAIDDNTNGAYKNGSVTHTSKNSNQAWWQVRLNQSSTIESVVIYNRTDGCCVARLSNYTVSVLDDNGNIVFSRVFNAAPNPSNSINVGGLTGRTVRVQLNGSNPLSLAEVQVMGY